MAKSSVFDLVISETDLKLIKDFINLYESCRYKYDEYVEKYNDIELKKIQKEKEYWHIESKQGNTSAPKELERLLKRLKEKEKYMEIVNIYNEIYAGNLSAYFKYISKEEYNRRKNQTESYEVFCNNIEILKECTITQIYRNIKYLLQIYEKICKIRAKKYNFIEKKLFEIKLKKQLIPENEICYIDVEDLTKTLALFVRIKDMLKQFVSDYDIKIKNAIKKVEDYKKEATLDKPIVYDAKIVTEESQQDREEIIQIICYYTNRMQKVNKLERQRTAIK